MHYARQRKEMQKLITRTKEGMPLQYMLRKQVQILTNKSKTLEMKKRFKNYA